MLVNIFVAIILSSYDMVIALNPDASVWELYRDVRTLGLELSASHIARNLHVPWSLHADDARPSRGLFCC